MKHRKGSSKMNTSSLLVIIPTFNEAGTILTVLEGVQKYLPDTAVLVVDDNSPDGTGELVENYSEMNPDINIMHRKMKDGLRAAYSAGFVWALRNGYDYVVQMDADGSHQPAQLPDLVAPVLDGIADISVGARWVPGGSTQNWPWYRKLLSKGGSFYSAHMLKLDLHDLTSGFRCFKSSVLKDLDLDALTSKGYGFQIETLKSALDKGYRVIEVPIDFMQRLHGESKMSLSIMVEALWNVTKWGVKLRSQSSKTYPIV